MSVLTSSPSMRGVQIKIASTQLQDTSSHIGETAEHHLLLAQQAMVMHLASLIAQQHPRCTAMTFTIGAKDSSITQVTTTVQDYYGYPRHSVVDHHTVSPHILRTAKALHVHERHLGLHLAELNRLNEGSGVRMHNTRFTDGYDKLVIEISEG